MYARSTTIDARPESMDEGIAYIRDEVMPALQAMDGCIGMSMLADRASGRCIITSSWRSEEAMMASDDGARSMREQAAERLGGGSPQVDRWEIAVMHRDHPTHDGACARVTWMETDASQIDTAIETFKVGVMPMAEQLPGWCSASLFVDRSSGRAVVTSTYENAESMDASRDRAQDLRSRTVGEANGRILDIAEFELVFAHLRVPELV